MFGLGWPEILVIVLVAAILFFVFRKNNTNKL